MVEAADPRADTLVFDLGAGSRSVLVPTLGVYQPGGEVEINHGWSPPILVTPYLLKMKHAKEVLLLGEVLDAQWALRVGMVNRVGISVIGKPVVAPPAMPSGLSDDRGVPSERVGCRLPPPSRCADTIRVHSA